jgi:GntR family transcriptional regulator, transcriptional repressor for pyruvate dehydrogenase complex
MIAQYRVGRGTLRECLRYLEMNGVISMRPGPGGGPVVAEPTAHDFASTLGLFLELKRTTFGAILEVREVLEPAIAAAAARACRPEVVSALTDSVQRMEAGLGDLSQFLEENERFHRLIATSAGNPVFELLIGSLDYITDGSRLGIDFPPKRREAVCQAHRVIADAIAAGDAVAAESAMHRHVHEFRRYASKNYPVAERSALRWRDIAP